MEPSEALRILTALLDGIDPETGEVYPPESPYQKAATVRALVHAVEAVKRQIIAEERASCRVSNRGKIWTIAEDAELLRAFDAGTPYEALAQAFERSQGAIRSRLAKLGRLDLDHPAQRN